MAQATQQFGPSFGPEGKPLPYVLREGKNIVAFRSNIPRYAHLSNFYHPFDGITTADGQTYPTVEHGYQSRMADLAEDNIKAYLLAHYSLPAVQVKKQARDMKRAWNPALRTCMENMRPHLMRPLLRAKFNIPELKEALLATGDDSLIEVSPGDTFWGSGVDQKSTIRGNMPKKFYNTAGVLLEEVREEIRTGKPVGPATLMVRRFIINLADQLQPYHRGCGHLLLEGPHQGGFPQNPQIRQDPLGKTRRHPPQQGDDVPVHLQRPKAPARC